MFSWSRQEVVHLPAHTDEEITKGTACLQTLVDESVVGEFTSVDVHACTEVYH